MYAKLLKDVVASSAGQNAAAIIDLLDGKKNVNEFLIAKKLKMTINQTRNVLYRLSDDGFVTFTRKKDSKKGGWYTYFWTLNLEKSLAKFKEKLQKDIDLMHNQINIKKTARFFICKEGHVEMNEEQALQHDYLCPECGEILQLKDTSAEVIECQKKIAALEVELKSVSVQLDEIHVIESKKKDRRMKLEHKKMLADRALRKKQREKELKTQGTAKKRDGIYRKPLKTKVQKKGGKSKKK
jgi:transcription initiation factor TFIIE subunit alpha